MAKYRALAPLYIDNRYIEIGELLSDDNTAGYTPIPSTYVPSPACDPLDADGIAKLTAAPHTQPSPTTCVLGLWGIRGQWQTLPLPALSAAWKSLVTP